MSESRGWSRQVTPRELAVLKHFDRRSAWAIVMEADLAVPLDPHVLDVVHDRYPILGARLRGDTWEAGAAPRMGPVDVDVGAFDLAHEGPLRVAASGRWLRLVAHHAALDGLGLVAVLAALVGAPTPAAPVRASGSSRGGRLRSVADRVRRPAPRLRPTADRPGDVRIARDLATGAGAEALVGAVVDALRADPARLDHPERPIGVSIGVGGQAVVGNTASYRRLDLARGADVGPGLTAALARPEPVELRVPPFLVGWLAPVLELLSDTVLVSNLGVLALPGVQRLSFWPVARGRSAVALGAATVVGGPATLTLRARDLGSADATALLADVVSRLPA